MYNDKNKLNAQLLCLCCNEGDEYAILMRRQNNEVTAKHSLTVPIRCVYISKSTR